MWTEAEREFVATASPSCKRSTWTATRRSRSRTRKSPWAGTSRATTETDVTSTTRARIVPVRGTRLLRGRPTKIWLGGGSWAPRKPPRPYSPARNRVCPFYLIVPALKRNSRSISVDVSLLNFNDFSNLHGSKWSKRWWIANFYVHIEIDVSILGKKKFFRVCMESLWPLS